jgi:hypothetical protein
MSAIDDLAGMTQEMREGRMSADDARQALGLPNLIAGAWVILAAADTDEEAWAKRAMDKAERAAISSHGMGNTPSPDPVQPYAEREDVQRAVGKAMGQ